MIAYTMQHEGIISGNMKTHKNAEQQSDRKTILLHQLKNFLYLWWTVSCLTIIFFSEDPHENVKKKGIKRIEEQDIQSSNRPDYVDGILKTGDEPWCVCERERVREVGRAGGGGGGGGGQGGGGRQASSLLLLFAEVD